MKETVKLADGIIVKCIVKSANHRGQRPFRSGHYVLHGDEYVKVRRVRRQGREADWKEVSRIPR